MYFAKYIKARGPIGYGDWVIHLPTGNVIQVTDATILEKVKAKGMLKKYRKAKLFLCSNDIKVGDMVKEPHIMDRKWCEVTDKPIENNTKPMILLEWALEGNAFKILGEISPEAATFVKNGQELKLTDFNPLAAAAIEHGKRLRTLIRIKAPNGKYY